MMAESRLDTIAQSPVGARGIAQIMPKTWTELARQNGVRETVSPFDADTGIMLGAIYQMKQRLAWQPTGRTNVQRNDLGLASYNRGLGNILNDQKACGNARLWEQIAPCTARITVETVQYVNRIHSYHAGMAAP